MSSRITTGVRAFLFFSIATFITVLFPSTARALSNSAKVPILVYHTWDSSGCSYDTNSLMALQSDLQTILDAGFFVMPVYWIAEWIVGDRDGSTLPDKVVGITLDDGPDTDWQETYCGVGGAYNILSNFKTAHSDVLPTLSPHASAFVIASPSARSAISSATGKNLDEAWWYSAQNSGVMEVYNHSVDHDHESIYGPLYDPYMNYITLVIAGNVALGGDGNYTGQGLEGHFARINNHDLSYAEVVNAASYIGGKIGVWPDLFAYPYGNPNSYMTNTFFPSYWSEHMTYAAFCQQEQYATRMSSRYCIPRITHKVSWNSTGGLQSILSTAP